MIAPGSERTSGVHTSGPNTERSPVCTGPEMSKVERKTKPRMYAGIASGSTSSQTSMSRSGNR